MPVQKLRKPSKLTQLEQQISAPKTSRNSPCPCGNGLKYKRCCLNKD